MRLADHLVSSLMKENIKCVFTVSGRGSLYLTDALARRPEIQVVAMHNEQAAAYAAVAAADISSNLSVCLVSTGCAMTNAVSGVLSAWQDEQPVLFISGQNTLSETTRFTTSTRRTYGEQETDIISVVKPITKFAQMLTCKDDLDGVLSEAIGAAQSGRKGPVWIDIPLDLQSSNIEDVDHRNDSRVLESLTETDVNVEVQRVTSFLARSARPVFLVGGGVRRDSAVKEFRELAVRLNLPVVFDSSAVDVFGSAYPNSIGSVGSMGCSRAGNIVLQNSDLVIAIGSQLRSSLTGEKRELFIPDATLILVDVDDSCWDPGAGNSSHFIRSTSKNFLRNWLDCHPTRGIADWQNWIKWAGFIKNEVKTYEYDPKKTNGIDLYFLADELSEVLSKDSVLVTESGLTEVILPTSVHLNSMQRSIHPVSQGAMGFGLPAAISVALHNRSAQVVLATGDGSIMMNLQEIQTMVHFGLPIKILLVVNDGYSVIRKRQKELFRGRTIGTDKTNGISFPDFERVASAFGVPFVRVSDPSMLRLALVDVLGRPTPVICEIQGLPDQDYVRTARARTEKGELRSRPIDDQFPFLDPEYLSRIAYHRAGEKSSSG